MFAGLSIQHAMRMPHIFICGPSSSTIFFYIISLTTRFSEKVIEYEMCVLSLSKGFV